MEKFTFTFNYDKRFENARNNIKSLGGGLSGVANMAIAEAIKGNMPIPMDDLRGKAIYKSTTIQLTKAHNEWLNINCKPTNSKASYVREAIIAYLNR